MSYEHFGVGQSIPFDDRGITALGTPQSHTAATTLGNIGGTMGVMGTMDTFGESRPRLTLVPDGFGITPATTEDDEWQDRALCAQTDPEAFFPEKGGSTREAKRICMGCEVRDACLDYALAHDERFGIWGGLSERERRRLKRGIG